MKKVLRRFWNKINCLRKMSQLKLFSIFVVILVVPITFISVFCCNLVINEARNRYVYSLKMETQQLANTLGAELGNLLSAGRMMISDDRLKTLLDNYYSGKTDFRETSEQLEMSISGYERTCLMASSLPPKIALMTQDGEVFGNNLEGDVFRKVAFLEEISALHGTNSNAKWTSDSEIFSKGRPSHADCLYLMLAIRDSSTFRTIATVVIQLRSNVLASRILPNMYDYQSSMVVSKTGNRIVELDYLHIADQFEEWMDISQIEVLSGQTIEKTVNHMDSVASNYSIGKTDWNIITISNMEEFTSLKRIYMRNFTLALSIVLILSFLIAFRVSRKFMQPVIDLNNQMKLVENGNLKAHLEPSSDDEIGELTRQFNDMIDHITRLIELNKMKEEEKRISDMKFLQAQINPHFIYNTLTLLRYSVLTGNQRQVDRIIIALNNIMRYALSNDKQFVTLNRALEWIKDYLVIVNCSMKEPVDVSFDIEPGVGDCQIIRMLIQPIVENAAFHGLKNCASTPKLRIIARRDGNDLIISIWDNGPGFDTDELAKHKSSVDRRSIGVENVDQRIRLYYGEQYGVRYRSYKEGVQEGSEAHIVIPIVKREDGDILINEYSDCR